MTISEKVFEELDKAFQRVDRRPFGMGSQHSVPQELLPTGHNNIYPAGFVAEEAIDDEAVFAPTLRPVQVVEDTLPTLPDTTFPTDRAVVIRQTDGKIYRNVADSWTAQVAVEDLDGEITETQIADGSISTPKLAANAVIANVINAGGTVLINSDGITILDESGASLLTAAGFAGSWTDFLGSMLYNSHFAAGDDFAVTGHGATGTLPYWLITLYHGGAGNAEASRVTDGSSVPFLQLKGTATSTDEETMEFVQDSSAGANDYPVTLIGGQRYQVIAGTRFNGVSGKPVSLQVELQWVLGNGTAGSVETLTLASGITSDEGGITWHSAFVEVPEDVVGASVLGRVTCSGTHLGHENKVYFVGIQPANSYWSGAPGVSMVETDKDVRSDGIITAATRLASEGDLVVDGVTIDVDSGSGNLRLLADVEVDSLARSGEDWTAVSFTNSWVNFGSSLETAAYRKDADGFVHLRGVIKSGTIGQAAFTLPAGYRPTGDKRFACVSNNAFGGLNINTAGAVTPNVGSNASFSLDGVTFRP